MKNNAVGQTYGWLIFLKRLSTFLIFWSCFDFKLVGKHLYRAVLRLC